MENPTNGAQFFEFAFWSPTYWINTCIKYTINNKYIDWKTYNTLPTIWTFVMLQYIIYFMSSKIEYISCGKILHIRSCLKVNAHEKKSVENVLLTCPLSLPSKPSMSRTNIEGSMHLDISIPFVVWVLCIEIMFILNINRYSANLHFWIEQLRKMSKVWSKTKWHVYKGLACSGRSV